MLYALFTFSIYISCHFHLCSLEHLFSCDFYFSYLSFSFPFLRYLIININPKKYLMLLGLFGYYPWHYGAWDFFLDLGLEVMSPWNSVIFGWYFCEDLLKSLGFTPRHWFDFFVCRLFWFSCFVCDWEFLYI